MTYRHFIIAFFASSFLAAISAEEVSMKAENAVVITFDSQTQRNYKLLGAENASGQWTTLQDGIVGTGGEVTIFYKSESDQKLFFKVETSDGPAGQRSLLSLANLEISNKNLSSYDLEGHDLRGFTFLNSQFDGANLSAVNLSEARFTNSTFANADLSHAVAVQVNMGGASFQGANLEGIRFVGGYLGRSDFRNANLKGVVFDGTALEFANFAGQPLTNMSFRSAGSKWIIPPTDVIWPIGGLRSVDFSGANLSGSDLSRNWAVGMNLVGANITGVNFEGTVLNDISMSGRDLRTVFLRGIIASGGDWTGVNAAGVDLSLAVNENWRTDGATFESANLEGVVAGSTQRAYSVTNVNFRNSNLRGAVLERITFQNCDFTGADLSFANVVAAQFPGCVGLDPEQPGMQFGPGPYEGPFTPVYPPGTMLPDGTARLGTNPGVGLAPATPPAKLQFVIVDGATNTTLNYVFQATSHTVNGASQGTFTYAARGRVAQLKLTNNFGREYYRKLLFTSATGGELFNSGNSGGFRIGTFTVVE